MNEPRKNFATKRVCQMQRQKHTNTNSNANANANANTDTDEAQKQGGKQLVCTVYNCKGNSFQKKIR